jgi:6-phosphogluconolactonase
MVASYGTGQAVRLPRGTDGSFADTPPLPLDLDAPGPHRTEQAPSHLHQITGYVTTAFDTNRHIGPDKESDKVFV